jgi:purine-binding chemotaxis protein CheW
MPVLTRHGSFRLLKSCACQSEVHFCFGDAVQEALSSNGKSKVHRETAGSDGSKLKKMPIQKYETMTGHAASATRSLVVRVQSRVCAVPLIHVLETMRPLPVEPIAGVPSFVRGVSIIRGVVTPVVDLAAILGMPGGGAERFVTLRLGDRQVALSVGAVLGVRELDASEIQELPPLLRGTSQDVVETLGTLDEEVLTVLRAGWELPDEVWRALAAEEVAS